MALAGLALRLFGGDLGGGYFSGSRPELVFAPVAAGVFLLLGLLVAPEQPQGQAGQRHAEPDARDRADHAHQGALDEQLDQQRPASQAQHAQQCELGPAQGHRQPLRRIDQEAAGEQGDHGQHLEIDSIGARQAVAAPHLGLPRHDLGVRRQDPADLGLDPALTEAGGQAQVDPLEAAKLAEPPLGRGDVDDADATILAHIGQGPGDPERRAPSGGEEGDLARRRAPNGLERCGGEFDRHVVERRLLFPQRRAADVCADQAGGRRPRAQDVEAQQGEAVAAACGPRGQLDDGTGDRDPRQPGERRIERLVEAAGRGGTHLQVRVAVHGVDRTAELVEGGLVHQVHGEAERHPHRDRQSRQDDPARAGAPLAQHHPDQRPAADAGLSAHGVAPAPLRSAQGSGRPRLRRVRSG